MTPLSALWLPIVVSVVVVFVMSSILHMAPLWHRNDYQAPPDQGSLQDTLRGFNIPPGDYMLPRAASGAEARTKEFQEKCKRGPMVVLTVMGGQPWLMGKTFVQWILYVAVITTFGAYIGSRALGPTSEYLDVFRFVGATTFVGYGMGQWPITIWFKRGSGLAIKETLDAFIYGLLTAGVFGWLWPR